MVAELLHVGGVGDEQDPDTSLLGTGERPGEQNGTGAFEPLPSASDAAKTVP